MASPVLCADCGHGRGMHGLPSVSSGRPLLGCRDVNCRCPAFDEGRQPIHTSDREWWRCPPKPRETGLGITRAEEPHCGVVFSAPKGHTLLLCPVCRSHCKKIDFDTRKARPGRDMVVALARRGLGLVYPDDPGLVDALGAELERWLSGSCSRCERRLPASDNTWNRGVCEECIKLEQEEIATERDRRENEETPAPDEDEDGADLDG